MPDSTISDEAAWQQQVADSFREAEKALKRYERMTLTPLLPAINQLRYAGEHMVSAGQCEGKSRVEALRKALGHCDRARYDVLECTIAEILTAFARLQDGGYTTAELQSVWPGYASVKPILLNGQQALEAAPPPKALDAAAIEHLQSHLDALIEVYDELRKHLDEIDTARKATFEARQQEIARARQAQEAAAAQREDRRYWLSMMLTIFGLVIGIWGLLITGCESNDRAMDSVDLSIQSASIP